MFGFSFPTLVIMGIAAIMLFGKDLPGVARTVGRHLAEFKKHLRVIEDAIATSTSEVQRSSSYSPPRNVYREEEREEATAPKFEPPPAAPAAPHVDPTSTPV